MLRKIPSQSRLLVICLVPHEYLGLIPRIGGRRS
jgi:hypothetical protein